MKFGRHLEAERALLDDPRWSAACLEYNELKRFLKDRCRPCGVQLLPTGEWSATGVGAATASALGDEPRTTGTTSLAATLGSRLAQLAEVCPAFIRQLDSNVAKLEAFFLEETGRLREASMNGQAGGTRVTTATAPPVAASPPTLLRSIVRLEKFIFLNFTGICKILKKFDKVTGMRMSEGYVQKCVAQTCFYRSEGLAALKLDVLRRVSGVTGTTAGAPTSGASNAGEPTADSAYASSSSTASTVPENAAAANHAPPLAMLHAETLGSGMLNIDSTPANWFPAPAALDSQKIIVTMQGAHGTDIIGALLASLEPYHVLIEDVMISRLYHDLTCAVLVRVTSDNTQLYKDLAMAAAKWGAELHYQVHSDRERLPKSLDEAPYENRSKYAATVMNQNGLTAPFLSAFTNMLLRYKISVEALKRLNEGVLCVLEMKLSVPADADLDQFRADVFQLSSSMGTDVALQPDDVFRKSKRLVVLDMDSTLIQQEVIDELARHAGVVSEVAAITHRAMNGELDFKESLRLRVALLKGSPVGLMDKVRQSLVFTEGAHFLCRALKRLGYKLAVISGGFIPLANYVKNELGLDYAFANSLKVTPDGKRLVGETTGPIVDGERKAELLEVIAQAESISPEQVIAIGDGANDLFMLAAAGLGIAFNAKPKVQEKARTRINQKSLKNVLYLLGHSDTDIETLLR